MGHQREEWIRKKQRKKGVLIDHESSSTAGPVLSAAIIVPGIIHKDLAKLSSEKNGF
jgi:hypothetical protein